MAPEPPLVRHTFAVPQDEAEPALAALLAAFPDGLEQEEADGLVLLSGYLPPGVPPPSTGLRAVARPVPGGWQDGWRRFHRPVRLGRFWIGPPWLTADAGSEAIVIEPGQAFGTGAHGSTRAAGLLLLDEAGRGSVLDLGCGSGVLSILAARLGHGPVAALDVDPLAVAATAENACRNGVDVSTWTADALRDPLPLADLALANLQHDLLVPLARRAAELPPRLIVSGLLATETFAPPGFRVGARAAVDGWQALVLEREA